MLSSRELAMAVIPDVRHDPRVDIGRAGADASVPLSGQDSIDPGI
jgi:hypothetical protein